MNLDVLPLSITMLAGPQIVAAIIFTTAQRPYRISAAFLAGIMISTVAGTAAAYGLATLLDIHGALGNPSHRSSVGRIIQYALVALLVGLAVKNYLGRRTAEPPKWLGALLTADTRRALHTGLLLILVMPSDVLIMLTVGIDLRTHGQSFAAVLPFLGAVLLMGALPLIVFTLFHPWMKTEMPKVRDWLNSHSWLVNILCCVLFILIILGGS